MDTYCLSGKTITQNCEESGDSVERVRSIVNRNDQPKRLPKQRRHNDVRLHKFMEAEKWQAQKNRFNLRRAIAY